MTLLKELETHGWYWDDLADVLVGEDICYTFSNPNYPDYSLEFRIELHWAQIGTRSKGAISMVTLKGTLSLFDAVMKTVFKWSSSYLPLSEIEDQIEQYEEGDK